MKRVAVIDCGISNVGSVIHAFDHLGIASRLAVSPRDLDDCSHIVLPGDGSFPVGMRLLHETGLDEAVSRAAHLGVPVLGICLGMQMMGELGDEFEPTRGLGLTCGHIVRIAPADTSLPVPQIGWNDVEFYRDSRLSHGLGPRAPFYFMQSYAFADPSASAVSGVCDYGGPVVAMIEQGNIFGVQFHPEKSQRAGLAVLRNFVSVG